MDTWVYLFLIALLLIVYVVRLLRPEVSLYEKAFLLFLITGTGYMAWERYTKHTFAEGETRNKVEKILEVVREDLVAHNMEMKVPFEKVLLSDPQLLRAMLALTKYADYDRDGINKVIRNTVDFYELYADMLLEIKGVRNHIKTLVDLRYKLLKEMHSLFVSMPHSKHVKVFQHIGLVLQSSTYKSLNVLKNKYGITDHEPPLAENVFDNQFEMY